MSFQNTISSYRFLSVYPSLSHKICSGSGNQYLIQSHNETTEKVFELQRSLAEIMEAFGYGNTHVIKLEGFA
jgi:hypothetical protein